MLVHLGVNTTTEIKPGSLWRHLLQDFCRDLLVRSAQVKVIIQIMFRAAIPTGAMALEQRQRKWTGVDQCQK